MISDRVTQATLCLVIAATIFLPIAAAMIWKKRIIYSRKPEEDTYYIGYGAWHRIVGYVCTIGAYGFVVMTVFVIDADLLAMAIFLCFVLLGIASILIAILWEIKVEQEVLIMYRFPLPVKEIRFSEITTVRLQEKLARTQVEGRVHLIAYRDGKKLFDVDDTMINFDRIFERFDRESVLERAYQKEYGKVELLEVKEEFSVVKTRADRIRSVYFMALGVMLSVGVLFVREELMEDGVASVLIFGAFSFCMLVLGTKEFLYAMLWKLTVNYRNIQVRSAVGRVYTFSFRDIEWMDVKEHNISLYVEGGKVFKVEKNCKNFALLAERLRREMEERELPE